MSPLTQAVAVFHGKAPRLFWRMLSGDPRAWSDAARTPRAEIQAALRTAGLEMRLAERTYFTRRPATRPGRRQPFYDRTHQVGEIVPCP